MTPHWVPLDSRAWGDGLILDTGDDAWGFMVVREGTVVDDALSTLVNEKQSVSDGYELHLVAYRRGLELFDTVTLRYVDGFWTMEFAQAFAEIMTAKKLPPTWDGQWHGHVDVGAASTLSDFIKTRSRV